MNANPPARLLGVLGGMGPLATADFLNKLIASTGADSDQEHVPVVVLSDPRIPDRTDAMLSGSEAPVLAALAARAQQLLAAGATAIVIPCNTAHHWFDRLAAACPAPYLHIADAAIDTLAQRVGSGARVAVLATAGTLLSGFYAQRLKAAGYAPMTLEPATIDAVMRAIRSVKAGDVAAGTALLQPIVDDLQAQGADALLLACTELPVALADALTRDPRLIDVTQALVDRCIAWARADQPQRAGAAAG